MVTIPLKQFDNDIVIYLRDPPAKEEGGDGSQRQKGSVIEVIRIQRDDQMFTVQWSEVEWRRIWSEFLYLQGKGIL